MFTKCCSLSLSTSNSTLDSRLSKTVPSQTQTLSTPPTTTAPQTFTNHRITANQPAATSAADRQLVFTSGKATAFRGTHCKTIANTRVHVANDTLPTPLGALSKVYAVSGAQQQRNTTATAALWEVFVGSPVVNFALSVRYALLCSVDGTVRLLDVETGVQALPLVKLPTPAVQCCFVSNNMVNPSCRLFFFYLVLASVYNFAICVVFFCTQSPNSDLAGCITESGTVRIWRLHPAPARIHINTVCSDVLGGGGGSGGYVSHFHCTDAGVVFVVLANGCSYSYCPQLESW